MSSWLVSKPKGHLLPVLAPSPVLYELSLPHAVQLLKPLPLPLAQLRDGQWPRSRDSDGAGGDVRAPPKVLHIG